jgi:diguanylate cyclase (GGDEF)-like protein/hemerythrin-like metal-binding protein/PAS domain S-box-containing protein
MTNSSPAAEHRWFKQLFELSPDPAWIIDGNKFVECNQAAVKTLGYANREDLLDIHPSKLSPPVQPEGEQSFARAERMMALARANGLHRFEWTHTRADGSDFIAEVTLSNIDLEDRHVIYCVWRDITDRKHMEDQIRRLAYHDPLTNLPNRRILGERLDQAIEAGKRTGFFGALMFLDLDNFKPLNDRHGHEVGDLLLLETAGRLKNCVRETDIVARFGGDEFVVMLDNLSQDEADSAARAEIVAEKIRAALSEPYLLQIRREDRQDVTIKHCCTASIGVALFGNHAASCDVLKSADAAMYEAKDSGRNLVHFAFELPPPDVTENTAMANFVHLVWRPAYECGNAVIDTQHRALFTTANTLLTAILCGRRTDKVAALIDVLIRDVILHFHEEEVIILAAGFPGAAEHAITHANLLQRAATLVSRFRADSLALGELFQFLAHDLVARHMLRADREFFPYLAPSGQ